jgi:hypothetical protein
MVGLPVSENVTLTSPIQIKDANEIDTPQVKKYIVPKGLKLIGYLLFYQYPVPLELSRRDNILVESILKVP